MKARWPITLLGVVLVLHFASYSMALTIVPLLAVRLGASAAVIGALAASLSVVPMLLAVRVGGWIDRFGPKLGLMVASCLLVVAPIAALARPGVPALFVTEVALGIVNLLAVVSGQAYTGRLGSRLDRELNFALYATFVSIGQVVGPLVAGVVSDWQGFAAALSGVVALALAACLSTLLLTGSARHSRAPASPARRHGGVEQARSLLGSPAVQNAILAAFAIAFGQSVFLAFFPVILKSWSLSAGTVGGLLALRALVSAVVRPFLPAVIRWLGSRQRGLMVMVGVIGLAFTVLAAGHGIGLAAAAGVAVGIGWGFGPPLSVVMVADGAAVDAMGFALGVRLTASRLAKLVGPLLVGAVATEVSLPMGFAACGVALLFSVGLMRSRPG